ncbi:hypothetical protein BC835DRAFT_177013 [Cytidiella melzeri]|nr:hypothetical protein BC835DRAFT_177013 [Cytidiella melzeri]
MLQSLPAYGHVPLNNIQLLLCYYEVGLYVDSRGNPSRSTQTIEGEGTAERFACHQPYVLLFYSRCACYCWNHHALYLGRQRYLDEPCSSNRPGGLDGGRDTGITCSPRYENDGTCFTGNTRGPRPVARYVFELIPTIPLYLPGSSSSLSQSTCFAQSNSPPHSPRLNPALPWRFQARF